MVDAKGIQPEFQKSRSLIKILRRARHVEEYDIKSCASHERQARGRKGTNSHTNTGEITEEHSLSATRHPELVAVLLFLVALIALL